jgi:hypothetical protein
MTLSSGIRDCDCVFDASPPYRRLACREDWVSLAVIEQGLTQSAKRFSREWVSGHALRTGTLRWSGMDHDFCNVDGARRLKQRIEEYWRERGYSVDVKLIEAGFVAAMRSARTDVRSDMVNGLPTKRASNDDRSSTRNLLEVA